MATAESGTPRPGLARRLRARLGRVARLFTPRSLAARLSVVTAGVLAVALGLVSTVRTVALRERLYRSTATQMAVDYRTMAAHTRLYVAPGQMQEDAGYTAQQLNSPTVGVLVVDTAGQVTGSAPPQSQQYANVLPPLLTTAQYVKTLEQFEANPNIDDFLVDSGSGVQQIVVLEPAMSPGFGLAGLFELATPTTAVDQTVDQQLEFDILAGLLALLGAAAAIYFLLGRFLSPLQGMADASDEIARGNWAVDLPPPRGDDEVSRLSFAFDHMVRRIDQALAGERAEKSRMRDFLADASHSLRTPLTVLNGRLDLLLQGQLREGDELETSLRTLRVEGERMARIVRGLLLLTRLDEGENRQGQVVDVAAVLEGLRPRLEALAGERDLVVDVPAGLAVWATVDALETIVTNLAENAVRHTPEDGGLEVRADSVAGMTRLRVLDTGSGIAPDDLPRLFDRFYRGLTTGQRRDGGAGLGLSIVQRWAEALGGRAEAANRTDRRGAVFTVWLPAQAPAAWQGADG